MTTLISKIKDAYILEKCLERKRLLRHLIVSLNKDGRGAILTDHITYHFGRLRNGLGVCLHTNPQYSNLSGQFDFKEPMGFLGKVETNSKELESAVEYAKLSDTEILYVEEMWYFNMYLHGHNIDPPKKGQPSKKIISDSVVAHRKPRR